MRDVIFIRVAAFALILGLAAGVFSAVFTEKEIAEALGAWIPGFYECSQTELWIKAVYSGPLFSAAIFAMGLFVFGYIFTYPISFYYGYTFGFLITCALRCFGSSALLHILFKIPSILITSALLCKGSAAAVKFSSEAFSGLEFLELRTKTSKYLGQGLGYVILTFLPMIYETIFVPKILNLWDSF